METIAQWRKANKKRKKKVNPEQPSIVTVSHAEFLNWGDRQNNGEVTITMAEVLRTGYKISLSWPKKEIDLKPQCELNQFVS